MSFNTLTNDEIPDLGENIEYDLFDDALGFAVRSGAKLNKMRKERGYLKTTYLIDGATGHSQMIDNYRNDMNTDAVKTVNDAFTHVMKKILNWHQLALMLLSKKSWKKFSKQTRQDLLI